MKTLRRYPIGAEWNEAAQLTSVRIWSPNAQRVELISRERTWSLAPEPEGYYSNEFADLKPGDTYAFKLDGEGPFPDPASRFQPEGPHGPSQVVDSHAYRWKDANWRGVSLPGTVLYELHVGTFTPEGTWTAAIEKLPHLAKTGVTCLEIMPVAEFPGRFGWGYDGVNPFAPTRLYGTPDDFRRFVDAAHSHRIGVILDVVYNHLGPDGNYLSRISPPVFQSPHSTDWGEAINFDGLNCGPVREYFLTNAAYWIDEFHLDGLRLDATQNIYDNGSTGEHILTAIGKAVRKAAHGRSTIIVAENEPQDVTLIRPLEKGGYGLDSVWNDDYHHAARVALTGRSEAYTHDYRGTAQEFISAAKYGYLYQGQWYSWQKQRRGQAGLDLPPAAFVNFTQNHDQIANSGLGLRAHQVSNPARYRALMALTLLLPGTPMLFQGQEFQASAPFLYFADHGPPLCGQVESGRIQFLAQFTSLTDRDLQFAAPHDAATFERCKLDWSECESHAEALRLTTDLLALRRSESAFALQSPRGVDGAVLSPHTFVLRFFEPGGDDRLLVVNLGRELEVPVCAEPLLAPPSKTTWELLLSTESPKYGGGGAVNPETTTGWRIPGEAACVLKPRELPE